MATLIIGSTGRLAQACLKHINNAVGYSIDPRELDDLYDKLKHYCHKSSIKAIVNCSAYTKVDDAETERSQCYNGNVRLVNVLANVAEFLDVPFIHYSTDYVFGPLPTDGRVQRRILCNGYSTHDMPEPLSYYAVTKHTSELIVLKYKKGTVCRVCGIYSHYKNDFLSKFISQIPSDCNFCEDPVTLKVSLNGYCNPTAADDIAIATNRILDNGIVGLLHVVCPEPTSWIDFFRMALIMSGKESYLDSIKLSTMEDIKGKQSNKIAQRPHFSAMCVGQLESHGIMLPHWKQSLWKYFNE